jgi:hypothetical protein
VSRKARDWGGAGGEVICTTFQYYLHYRVPVAANEWQVQWKWQPQTQAATQKGFALFSRFKSRTALSCKRPENEIRTHPSLSPPPPPPPPPPLSSCAARPAS